VPSWRAAGAPPRETLLAEVAPAEVYRLREVVRIAVAFAGMDVR
jgi:hypothetical protein